MSRDPQGNMRARTGFANGALAHALASISLVAMLVAACGGSSAGQTPSATASSAATPASTPTAAAQSAAPTGSGTSTASPNPTAATSPQASPSALARKSWQTGLRVVATSPVAPGVGWVLAQTGLYETNDDGATWATVTPVGLKIAYTVKNASLAYSNVVGLAASDGQHAYIATSSAKGKMVTITVWRTANGGAGWKSAAAPAVAVPVLPDGIGTAYPPVTFDIVDAQHAFFSFYESAGMDTFEDWVFETTDGGASWKLLPYTIPAETVGLPPGVGVYFQSPLAGVFEFGRVAMSTATGWGNWHKTVFTAGSGTWQNQPVTLLAANNWAIVGPSDGTSIDYATSSNQGATWSLHSRKLPGVAGAYDSTTAVLGPSLWVVAILTSTSRETYLTSNAGTTWTKVGSQPDPATQKAAVFLDKNHAWSSPQMSGQLYVTENGGAAWKLVTP